LFSSGIGYSSSALALLGRHVFDAAFVVLVVVPINH